MELDIGIDAYCGVADVQHRVGEPFTSEEAEQVRAYLRRQFRDRGEPVRELPAARILRHQCADEAAEWWLRGRHLEAQSPAQAPAPAEPVPRPTFEPPDVAAMSVAELRAALPQATQDDVEDLRASLEADDRLTVQAAVAARLRQLEAGATDDDAGEGDAE